MFAVLKTGGKQYRVTAGDVLRVELLDAAAGDTIQFNDILMVGDSVGAPLVGGAAVQAEVIDQVKADKVITFHKRRRKHSSQRTRGHRQRLTLVRITGILESGAEASGVKAAVGTAAAARAIHGQPSAPPPEKKAKPKKARPAKEPAAEPVTAQEE
jgi:large subunit ribosomal protein L21